MHNRYFSFNKEGLSLEFEYSSAKCNRLDKRNSIDILLHLEHITFSNSSNFNGFLEGLQKTSHDPGLTRRRLFFQWSISYSSENWT